jgi:transketolase
MDVLAVLYADVLHVDPSAPDRPDRDRLVLSKGHAAAALYAVLALRGFFPEAWLAGYHQDGQPLGGHVTSAGVPGVELSTGSLGHGLPVGVGMALGLRRRGSAARVVVVMSDGECDEGSVWEAALLAAHHGLSQLAVVVDHNGLQSLGRVEDTLRLEPFADKWRAFGWQVTELDGHDHDALSAALSGPAGADPHCVIARTVKGRGVSFMEDSVAWHYRSPSGDLLEQARRELAGEPR